MDAHLTFVNVVLDVSVCDLTAHPTLAASNSLLLKYQTIYAEWQQNYRCALSHLTNWVL